MSPISWPACVWRRARVHRESAVFAACVDPHELARWWGPAGFTAPSVDLDVRDGGRYRITMQPPDGQAFHRADRYSEVDPRGRLCTRSMGRAGPTSETVVTLSFYDEREGAKLVVDQMAVGDPRRDTRPTRLAGRQTLEGYARISRASRLKSSRAGGADRLTGRVPADARVPGGSKSAFR